MGKRLTTAWTIMDSKSEFIIAATGYAGVDEIGIKKAPVRADTRDETINQSIKTLIDVDKPRNETRYIC